MLYIYFSSVNMSNGLEQLQQFEKYYLEMNHDNFKKLGNDI